MDKSNVEITVFNFTQTRVTMSINIPIRVKNDNYYGIKFREIKSTGQYRGIDLVQGKITGLLAKARQETDDTMLLTQTSSGATDAAAIAGLSVDCSSPVNTWNMTVKTDITLDTGGITFSTSTDVDLPCTTGKSTSTEGYVCTGRSVG